MKFFETVILIFSLTSLVFSELINDETNLPELTHPFHRFARQAATTNTSVLCGCKDFRINCDLKTACVSDCKNSTRYADEADCIFPFQYKGVWYDTCTDVDRPGKFWCSVDRLFNNKYADCEQKCPILARNLVKNDLNAIHTSCKPPGIGWKEIPITESEIKAIIDLHNNQRSNVTPIASDMKLLSWDFGLSRLALNLAMTGVFDHDCSNCRRILNNKTIYNGQNLWGSWGMTYNVDTTWKGVVNSWANEKSNYKYGVGSTNGGAVGHYTQIINSRAVRVGCAAAINEAGKSIIAACNYAYGQGSYSIPYMNGTACANCSNCVNTNLCNCNKICQNGGNLDIKSCTCSCPAYATGAECEIVTCDKTDDQYGCWDSKNPNYCLYSNTKPLCPNMCGMCSLR